MYKRRFKRNANGFTLIEVLFSLAITLMIVMNITSVISVVKVRNKIEDISLNYEAGIKSLSNYLVDAKEIEYGSSLLFKNSKDEECEVKLDNNRLVMTPGHVIFCDDIENINFYEKDHLIYLEYSVKDKTYKALIGSDFEDEIEENEDEEENEDLPIEP